VMLMMLRLCSTGRHVAHNPEGDAGVKICGST